MLLAIETATQECSVAVQTVDGTVLSFALDPKTRASALAEVVSKISIEHGRPSGYVIDIGPGSFTGLRVGVAFLKGLARAVPGPVQVTHSLEVLAQEMLSETSEPNAVAIPVLKASGIYVFSGAFIRDPDGLAKECEALPIGLYVASELAGQIDKHWSKGVWAAGEAVSLVPKLDAEVLPALNAPRATTLLHIAKRRVELGRAVLQAAEAIEPAYYQRSAAEVTRMQKRC